MSDRAAYMRQFRKDNPDYVKRQKLAQRAKERALADLAASHPGEFEVLLTIRRKELGLPRQM